MGKILIFRAVAAAFAVAVCPAPATFGQEIVIDHTCTGLSLIPDAWITQAKSDLHIAYQHTSHGSQLITGMNAMEAFPSFGTKYEWSEDGSSGLDLDDEGIPGCDDLSVGDYIDENGVTPWVTSTRNLLDSTANYHVNVVVWSWCSINLHNPQRYLDNMEILISEYGAGGTAARAAAYPVEFIFMTGHAEGQGENLYDDPQPDGTGHVHYNNQLIRQHCASYGRILFDFADIESYDPDGSYYWDLNMTDALYYTGGNWGEEWIDANPGTELQQLTSGCASCAHCDGPANKARINCVLKGRATWWLWARLAGWNGQTGAPTPTPAGGFTPTPPPSLPPTPSPRPTNPGSISPTVTPSVERTPTPPPALTPTPSPTPDVTPMCSPCAVCLTGCVYDSGTQAAIAGAQVKFDWVSRCEEYHYSLDLPTGCFDIWEGTHAAGEGSLEASAWGYQTELFAFTGCGDYIHDFYLTSSQAPTPTPTPQYLYTPSPTPINAITPSPTPTIFPVPTPVCLVFDSGDYDGDGTSDIAVFRGSSGLWAVRGITRLYFGNDFDLPVPGDYAGNGTAAVGIFRPAPGLWAINGITRVYFGGPPDLPAPADYDGDGDCDIGIFRESSGLWAVMGISRLYFGGTGDLPVPGDYDGSGPAVIGIFREASGLWAVRSVSRVYFGRAGDLPVPGDHDGDGIREEGIFRPSSGLWAIRGVTRCYFGTGADIPVPADFDGDGTPDIAIFRGSAGLWAIRGGTRGYFGTAGDIPVSR